MPGLETPPFDFGLKSGILSLTTACIPVQRINDNMNHAKITIPEKQVADLCQRYHVRSLALFGSVLREDFRPDSDVDVLVDFDPAAQIGFLALARMQRELADLLGRPVDLVPRQGLKPVIRDHVLASVEEIYAA